MRNQNNSYLCDIIFVKTTLLTKQGRYLFLKWVPAFVVLEERVSDLFERKYTLLYPLFDIAFSMTKDIGNPPPLHAMPHRRIPLKNGARGKTLCSAIPYFCYRDGATLILATV